MYTIPELAQAVGKTENYVRQHIYRGHLKPRKDGRQTYVTTEEALRWSRARGLRFAPPSGLPPDPQTGDRVGRLTVASFRSRNGVLVNAFSFLRIRRRDHLGPWSPVPDGCWRRHDLGHGFELSTLDTDPTRCEELISAALRTGTMNLGDRPCEYDILNPPRAYRAYRDHHGDHDAPIVSPFSDHSAEVREYWSRDSDIRRQLVAAMDGLETSWDGFAALGFPLGNRPDRLGNVMIASAWDSIKCTLSAQQTGGLAFDITGDPMPGEYTATVWGAHAGDFFFHQQLPVTSGRSSISLPIAPDRIGFEVFRSSDGECIDRMDVDLIVDVHVHLDASIGPAINLTDQRGNTIHAVNPARSRSRVVVSGEDASTVHGLVRTRNLGYHAAQTELTARREGRLARFGPSDFAGAIRHFIKLLQEDADRPEPVYIADRYFLLEVGGIQGIQLYSDMLSATISRELRVLCTQSPSNHPRPWWKKLPAELTRHLVVRCFLTHDPAPQPAFHDRYLITAERETLLSHSLNGWVRDGVTFVTLPFGVYRADAEYLWSIDLRSSQAPLFVEEYA